ncbi:glycosyltransferase family A protein [uncultured Kocuria sp.]|uniref:glycosyltransferase family A protein n=1 Tax=uncultured Kocuria sp. TaxID=259305 RepID=UPI002620DF88|nr:glycosyltransferase family A protein [uncultured Kocuria sp.]
MPPAPTPLVDVIIPVHTTARPVDRAVGSVVAGGLPVGGRGGVRITVVCHNVGAALIRDRLSARHRPLVELVECFDGTGNPAAPRNLALERSRARYVSFVDSDDTLAPGALAAWTAIAERHGSAAVLPRLLRGGGGVLRTPVPRPFRRADLDPVKDRLAYRTTSLGLLRREVLADRGLRFQGQYATGEDLGLTARAWFGGGRIDLAPRRAHYVVHDDADGRITTGARPLAEDLAAFTDLLGGSWYAGLPAQRRTAIAVKVLRVQLLGAVHARAAGAWTAEDTGTCRALLRLLEPGAGPALEVLPRADRDLLDLVVRQGATAAQVREASARRRRFGHPATLLTRDPRWVLHREAPLRFMAASLLV